MELVIYTPSYNGISALTISCIEKLHQESKVDFVWETGIGCEALISRGRNVCCYDFLRRRNAPYMLFLDSDVVFISQDVEKILEGLKSHDVVGGLYAVGDGSYLSSHNLGRPLNISGGCEEITYLATGFMGITRLVLEDMVIRLHLPLLHQDGFFEQYPFFEDKTSEEHLMFLSEDYVFCDKVREAGHKVYAHTGVQLGHEKTRIVWAQEAIKQTTVLAPFLLEDAEDYLGHSIKPLELATAKIETEKAFSGWEGNAESFYCDTDKYFMDLVAFNLQASYLSEVFNPIAGIKNKRILDYGCGIGTISIALAERGNKVTGFDINKKSIDFAQFRAKKHNVDVVFTTEEPCLKEYNFILANDVLEHIKDLSNFLLHIGEGVSVGCLFYHHNGFGLVNKLHYDHTAKFSEWMKKAGFLVWNKLWSIKVWDTDGVKPLPDYMEEELTEGISKGE